jgi:3-oxoacyl-[acyl-carrier protein] reductase
VGVHFNTGKAEAEETLAVISEAGGDGMLLQTDLANAEQAMGLVNQLVTQTEQLDILVNNAGALLQRVKIEDCPLENWEKTLAVNLTGSFLVTQKAIPHLKASGNGAIINNLSLSVQTGGANGAGPYAIAKGGLQVMTRTLARELAPEVRTNAIMPGVIETRHHERFTSPERMDEYKKETPMDRNGQPDEVADTVLFLASDAARFVNGALLDINGGRFLR